MKLPVLVPALAACVALAGPAASQTAEETVAFLVFGLEDGAKADMGPGGPVTMRLASPSPATYVGAVTGDPKRAGEEARVTVTQSDSCRYDLVTGIWKDGKETDVVRVARINFDRISSIAHEGGKLVVGGKGLCRVFSGQDCDPVDQAPLVAETEPSRLDRAYAHFRGNICKERAF